MVVRVRFPLEALGWVFSVGRWGDRTCSGSREVAHIGTYALAESLDQGAHIAGYALAAVGLGGLGSRGSLQRPAAWGGRYRCLWSEWERP
jgi:hypothetical protein